MDLDVVVLVVSASSPLSAAMFDVDTFHNETMDSSW